MIAGCSAGCIPVQQSIRVGAVKLTGALFDPVGNKKAHLTNQMSFKYVGGTSSKLYI